ncbi:MAG: crossover junction endodeoxyribonuclease RuvC [Deferribacterales bacterium]|nr:crossover junction endodeoxyribonuclease RuvC [Deferribacterales bacterium]
MIFMGIDPGLNKTGIGILHGEKGKVSYVAHRLITTDPKKPLPERLGKIISGVSDTVIQYKPQVAAIENIFTSNNAKSALLLGQARGAIIGALIANDVPVKEFSALQIKKAVTGYGKAEKEQVKRLVEIHLNMLFSGVPLDITDSLACAICLAYSETGGIPF